MSSQTHPSPPEPIVGRRGKLNIPQMPDVTGLHGRVRCQLPTGKYEFEFDHQPITMVGRVLTIDYDDVMVLE